MSNLLLLANLIRPGSISVVDGFVFHGEELIMRSESFYAEDWHYAVMAANKAGWPLFQPVTIQAAWEWLDRSGCINGGVGQGPLGRAWAALSHVTSDSLNRSSTIDLVWILIGLEALYAKGSNALERAAGLEDRSTFWS